MQDVTENLGHADSMKHLAIDIYDFDCKFNKIFVYHKLEFHQPEFC